MSNGVFDTTDPGTAGVSGTSEINTKDAGPGVLGRSDAAGVFGISRTWHGVAGQSESTTGGAEVFGEHKGSGAGVVGQSATGDGVVGISHSAQHSGVAGTNDMGGYGVYASSLWNMPLWLTCRCNWNK